MLISIQSKRILRLQLVLIIVLSCAVVSHSQDQKIVHELEKSLKSELLNIWYPICLDTVYGGYLSDFTHDWQARGRQNKMLVTQARHVWTASEASVFYHNDNYREIAAHGFRFLRDKMWDKKYGGFYMTRNRKGDSFRNDSKSAYGNAFAIYALATYYKVSGDTSALNLAKNTFLWLEKYSRDPEYGGYFDRLTRKGDWSDKNLLKDQNSSIHLLEAFTALYDIWPDSLLRQRLHELLIIIRDTIVAEKGYLTLFMQRDWTPLSFRDSPEAVRKANTYLDHVSFGHDVETAYLMLEASHALGLESDVKTMKIAKRMVDHALSRGWDEDTGGFYDAGYYFDDSDSISIINDAKIWWVEAEGLNALLLMSRLFPEEKKYEKAFKKQWEYIQKYLIDHTYGDWYGAGLDNSPEQRKAVKAYDWKVNYHNARALMNCVRMLKSEHELIRKHQ